MSSQKSSKLMCALLNVSIHTLDTRYIRICTLLFVFKCTFTLFCNINYVVLIIKYLNAVEYHIQMSGGRVLVSVEGRGAGNKTLLPGVQVLASAYIFFYTGWHSFLACTFSLASTKLLVYFGLPSKVGRKSALSSLFLGRLKPRRSEFNPKLNQQLSAT